MQDLLGATLILLAACSLADGDGGVQSTRLAGLPRRRLAGPSVMV